jgi:hypothetical protein
MVYESGRILKIRKFGDVTGCKNMLVDDKAWGCICLKVYKEKVFS